MKFTMLFAAIAATAVLVCGCEGQSGASGEASRSQILGTGNGQGSHGGGMTPSGTGTPGTGAYNTSGGAAGTGQSYNGAGTAGAGAGGMGAGSSTRGMSRPRGSGR